MQQGVVRPGPAPGFNIIYMPPTLRRVFDLVTIRTLLRAGLLAALILLVPASLHAIERRKPQFLTEPSYLFIPFPYSLPGIGEGIVFTGLAGNIAETNFDAFALLITGDAEGQIVGLGDMHILSETLILDTQFQNITKALVNNYETRGMNSDPNDFNLVEISSVRSTQIQLTLSLFDRRLEIFGGREKDEVEVPRVRDQQGNVIAELTPAFTSESERNFAGVLFDYTDDRQDPRKGVRLEIVRSDQPEDDPDEAEYLVWDFSATFYLPVGNISTLAFRYFQSDAEVTRQGNTDEASIRADLGFNCVLTDQVCLDAEQEVVNRFLPERRNGTSTSLGGDERLRSYPQNRFTGAHTVLYTIEFRWNLSEEVAPFDYFIWKDVRTGVQVAFFAETGSGGRPGTRWATLLPRPLGSGSGWCPGRDSSIAPTSRRGTRAANWC